MTGCLSACFLLIKKNKNKYKDKEDFKKFL